MPNLTDLVGSLGDAMNKLAPLDARTATDFTPFAEKADGLLKVYPKDWQELAPFDVTASTQFGKELNKLKQDAVGRKDYKSQREIELLEKGFQTTSKDLSDAKNPDLDADSKREARIRVQSYQRQLQTWRQKQYEDWKQERIKAEGLRKGVDQIAAQIQAEAEKLPTAQRNALQRAAGAIQDAVKNRDLDSLKLLVGGRRFDPNPLLGKADFKSFFDGWMSDNDVVPAAADARDATENKKIEEKDEEPLDEDTDTVENTEQEPTPTSEEERTAARIARKAEREKIKEELHAERAPKLEERAKDFLKRLTTSVPVTDADIAALRTERAKIQDAISRYYPTLQIPLPELARFGDTSENALTSAQDRGNLIRQQAQRIERDLDTLRQRWKRQPPQTIEATQSFGQELRQLEQSLQSLAYRNPQTARALRNAAADLKREIDTHPLASPSQKPTPEPTTESQADTDTEAEQPLTPQQTIALTDEPEAETLKPAPIIPVGAPAEPEEVPLTPSRIVSVGETVVPSTSLGAGPPPSTDATAITQTLEALKQIGTSPTVLKRVQERAQNAEQLQIEITQSLSEPRGMDFSALLQKLQQAHEATRGYEQALLNGLALLTMQTTLGATDAQSQLAATLVAGLSRTVQLSQIAATVQSAMQTAGTATQRSVKILSKITISPARADELADAADNAALIDVRAHYPHPETQATLRTLSKAENLAIICKSATLAPQTLSVSPILIGLNAGVKIAQTNPRLLRGLAPNLPEQLSAASSQLRMSSDQFEQRTEGFREENLAEASPTQAPETPAAFQPPVPLRDVGGSGSTQDGRTAAGRRPPPRGTRGAPSGSTLGTRPLSTGIPDRGLGQPSRSRSTPTLNEPIPLAAQLGALPKQPLSNFMALNASQQRSRREDDQREDDISNLGDLTDMAREENEVASLSGDTPVTEQSTVSEIGEAQRSPLELDEEGKSRSYMARPEDVDAPYAGQEEAVDPFTGGGEVRTPADEAARARSIASAQQRAREQLVSEDDESQSLFDRAKAAYRGAKAFTEGAAESAKTPTELRPVPGRDAGGRAPELELASQQSAARRMQELIGQQRKRMTDQLKEKFSKSAQAAAKKAANATLRVGAEAVQGVAAPEDIGITFLTLLVQMNIQLISKYILAGLFRARFEGSSEIADKAAEYFPEQSFPEDVLTISLDCCFCQSMVCGMVLPILIPMAIVASPLLAAIPGLGTVLTFLHKFFK